MTDKIRVGIIGANANYGWSKRAHLPALLGMPDLELTAVCTSRPETAEESKAFYGAKLAFHDYTEMANHPDVDLVVVSVSVPAHHGMVTAGLQAGKHVFCEWPLGANTTEAVELAALAQQKGVRSLIGLQARGGPALLYLKELVAEGYVGEMLACNMTMFLPGLLQRGIDRAWMAERSKGANNLSIASGHALDISVTALASSGSLPLKSACNWTSGRPAKETPSRWTRRQRDGKRNTGDRRGGLGPHRHHPLGRQRLAHGGLWHRGNAVGPLGGNGAVRKRTAIGSARGRTTFAATGSAVAAVKGSRYCPAGRTVQRGPVVPHHRRLHPKRWRCTARFRDSVARHRFLDLLQLSSDEGRKVVVS